MTELGKAIRAEFPVYSRYPTLAYLDTAASSLKPKTVVERISEYLSYEHANIHRGAYALSANSTLLYETARSRVQKFLNAAAAESIIFTRGTTESVNLVAHALEDYFHEGDVILLTLLEHHSNLVPWQLLAKRKRLRLEFVEVDDSGALRSDDLKDKIRTLRPKLLAISQLANSIGTVLPVEDAVREARKTKTLVFVDAAQSVAHSKIDVQALGVDFLAFSGHKLYGPTGIGVLFAKTELLEKMEPFQAGGGMIQKVELQKSTWAQIPQKFEAGTPPIAEAIALVAALDFVDNLGIVEIARHEQALFQKLVQLLSGLKKVSVYGPIKAHKDLQASIVAFNVDGVHPHDFSTVADSFGCQLRAGHHCAMPTMKRLGIPACARVSLGVYSDEIDFEPLLAAIEKARKMFQ